MVSMLLVKAVEKGESVEVLKILTGVRVLRVLRNLAVLVYVVVRVASVQIGRGTYIRDRNDVDGVS